MPRILLTGGGSRRSWNNKWRGEGEIWEIFLRGFLEYSLSLGVTMRSSTKRNRRKTQREAAREKRQGDPVFGNEAEESEIVFRTTKSPTDHPSPVPRSPPGSPSGSADLQYEDVLDMVQRLHKELGLITLDNDKIRTVCNQLPKDNQARDRAIGDLTALVERSLDCPAAQRSRPDAALGHPIIQLDLIDNEGNLRAEDIGITWEGSDTFLHGVRVVGPGAVRMRGDSVSLPRLHISWYENMWRVTCRLRDSHWDDRCAWRFLKCSATSTRGTSGLLTSGTYTTFR